MSKIEEAILNFRGNFNCAQAVLNSYSTQFGLEKDKTLKIASGFGGGMGGLGRTCGAVTGAYMVIGLKYGMGIDENIEAKGITSQIIRDFSDQFEKNNGSVICKELLGCDISTPEGEEYFDQNELFEKKCVQYVKDAIKILEQLLR